MKKKLLFSALAVALVAVIAVGSLAYFTDSTTTTNVFKATSTEPGQEQFDIEIYETDSEGEKDYDGLTFEQIAPGDVYTKDPTIENVGVYSAYIRVSVTVTEASAWQEICEKWNLDLEDIFGGIDSNFERKSEFYNAGSDSLTYVYYLNHVLESGDTATLFKTVTIPGVLDNEDMKSISEFELTVSADAIQSKNTGDNAFDAFADYWA